MGKHPTIIPVVLSLTLLLLATRFIGRDTVLRDTVDVIEVNHFVDGKAALIFDQVIFWRWNRVAAEYRVVGWRLLKNVREDESGPKQMRPAPDGWLPRPKWKGGHASPLRRHDRGGWWVSSWHDEKDHVLREVAAPMYRETWTSYDPELEDRYCLPQDKRSELRRPRKPG